MTQLQVSLRTVLLAGTLLLTAGVAAAESPLPILATGFCNTGLTKKAPQPQGCLTSTLVTPINPIGGGPIVDGNWDLAEPAPSLPSSSPAPNPCEVLALYRPVPVSAPEPFWYNPSDFLSQWIEPPGGTDPLPGWYIYRTDFTVPAPYPGYDNYELVIKGQFMADDYVAAVYLLDPIDTGSHCRVVAKFPAKSQYQNWNNLRIVAPVIPSSKGILYFVVLNASGNPPAGNPSGLRVEFTTPYLYPY